MLNIHNISIIWVQGFLILIENLLWLNLETFMWLNGFLPTIENVLWLEVKTLTRINQECTLVNQACWSSGSTEQSCHIGRSIDCWLGLPYYTLGIILNQFYFIFFSSNSMSSLVSSKQRYPRWVLSYLKFLPFQHILTTIFPYQNRKIEAS